MTLLVPDVGEEAMLEDIFKNASPEAQTLKLYTNAGKTPVEGDTDASYTEPSGNGYAAISLTRASWTVATVSGVTTASYAQQTFTFTGGPVTVVGYFVIKATAGTLLYAEKFSADAVVPSGGGTIKITPQVELA